MSDIVFGDPRLPARFWEKVKQSMDGCWWWTGARISTGYGHFSVGGRRRPAHRVAYESLVAAVPPGLVLDHLCRNPRQQRARKRAAR